MHRRDLLSTLAASLIGAPALRAWRDGARAVIGAGGRSESLDRGLDGGDDLQRRTSGGRGETGAAWKAGVATVDITPSGSTPSGSIWMAGFAARTKPAQGTALPLHAKALALEDVEGRRSVLVTLDLLGITARIAQRIADDVSRRHALPRARLLFNASHTHCGPVVDEMLSIAYDLTADQRTAIEAYSRDLEARVIRVIDAALGALQPARLTFGQGEATFAANRRVQFTPDGPVDHAVPVLRVEAVAAGGVGPSPPARPVASAPASSGPIVGVAAEGQPLAVVFGYACHNTTLQADFVQFHGDYAGVAQAVLERRHAGTTALFVTGCGADANPKPRGTVALVEQHGTALADAVDRVLAMASSVAAAAPASRAPASAAPASGSASASPASSQPAASATAAPAATSSAGSTPPVSSASLVTLSGRLDAGYDTVNLPFAPVPDRAGWTARLQDADPYVRRHARLMLDTLDRAGALPAAQPEPVQVWRFDRDLTLVALGGEVVVDYAIRVRKDYPESRTWIAGYSNDVFGYVPSLRVLNEGGYEGGGAMIYYGKPGAFASPVEDLIHAAIRRVMPPARATIR